MHAGNEGHGLRTNIRRVCTGLVRVDMGTQGQGFSGLGASVGGSRATTTSHSNLNISSSSSSGSRGSSSRGAGGKVNSGTSTSYWGGSDSGSDDFSDAPYPTGGGEWASVACGALFFGGTLLLPATVGLVLFAGLVCNEV